MEKNLQPVKYYTKYMISSIEDKVEIKKRAIPIVVGCIILFATTNIVVIIADIVGSI